VSVVIVAAGGANIASLQFALERIGARSEVSADAERIRIASHVILPGVGAAAHAMARLRATGLDVLIPSLTQPVLGICLGMQLLHEASAEGDTRCLSIIPGAASRFTGARGRPVPHMGWNTLEFDTGCPLLAGLYPGDYAYFVHSYALPVNEGTVASCCYGIRFGACVAQRNFLGVQFHPERSGRVGAQLLKNFLGMAPCG
jgi:imidazole glycerol-phosphate synthase subunit HisH